MPAAMAVGIAATFWDAVVPEAEAEVEVEVELEVEREVEAEVADEVEPEVWVTERVVWEPVIDAELVLKLGEPVVVLLVVEIVLDVGRFKAKPQSPKRSVTSSYIDQIKCYLQGVTEIGSGDLPLSDCSPPPPFW